MATFFAIAEWTCRLIGWLESAEQWRLRRAEHLQAKEEANAQPIDAEDESNYWRK
jgi:hypothetical protein